VAGGVWVLVAELSPRRALCWDDAGEGAVCDRRTGFPASMVNRRPKQVRPCRQSPARAAR